MQAFELLKQERLDDALAALQAEVRKHPQNPRHRIFLFQLLALLGQWERAATQLAVIGELDKDAGPMVQTYREALRCEAFRQKVFAGEKTPLVFGDPEEWIAKMVEGVRLDGLGKHAEADGLRQVALEAAPASSGEIDGQAFAWIADADSRLGPVCEAIINGKYYWVPFMRLRMIAIEPPADLRDYVWMPARMTFANGGEAVALIPARYAGSEADPESAIRMGRKTEWRQVAENTYFGVGQRTFATDVGEFPVMDVRSLRLAQAAAT